MVTTGNDKKNLSRTQVEKKEQKKKKVYIIYLKKKKKKALVAHGLKSNPAFYLLM